MFSNTFVSPAGASAPSGGESHSRAPNRFAVVIPLLKTMTVSVLEGAIVWVVAEGFVSTWNVTAMLPGRSYCSVSVLVLCATTLVDCDFGLACDHLLLGVKPALTLQQLLAGKETLDQVLVTSPCGPRLLPTPRGESP